MFRHLIAWVLLVAPALAGAQDIVNLQFQSSIRDINAREIAVSGDRLYTMSNRTLKIYSLSNPAEPVLASTRDIPSPSVGYFAAHNLTLYLGSVENSTLRVVDARNAQRLVFAPSIQIAPNSRPVVDGNTLYVGTTSEIRIFDLSVNPLAPRHLATVAGRRQFQVYRGTLVSPVNRYDVSNPAEPIFLGLPLLSSTTRQVSTNGTLYAYDMGGFIRLLAREASSYVSRGGINLESNPTSSDQDFSPMQFNNDLLWVGDDHYLQAIDLGSVNTI